MDQCNFLIWNVRGLNSRARRDNVKTLVLDIKPSLICLQETKMSNIFDFDILSILGAGYSNFVFSPAQGTRGGILVAWRHGVFTHNIHVIREYSVSIQLQEASGPLWWLTGVYGPHQDNLK
jgi:exonuclease III